MTDDEIWLDSLWIIDERAKGGLRDGSYHGNFVPQIPNQLIRRFTSSGDIVLDPFIGSGTTAIECDLLGRRCIGFDIQEKLIDDLKVKLPGHTFVCCDSVETDANIYQPKLTILHPPYMDIIKFTEDNSDLCNCEDIKAFCDKLVHVCNNTLAPTMALVIGDYYRNKQWVPLGFECMQSILKACPYYLKSIVVKNTCNTRAKQGQRKLWEYRANKNGFYLFAHEYIFLFKKI